MKACELCGTVHAAHQAHQFKSDAKPVTHKPVKAPSKLVANAPTVANKLVANRSGDRHKDKAARRAYMRDYMRAHRPKARS